MNANDQLQLSEDVCWQLRIVTYHPEAQVWRREQSQKQQLRQQSSPRVPQVVVRVQSQFYQVRGYPNHVHKKPLKICAGDELAIAKSAAVHLFNCPSTTFMLCKVIQPD